MELIGAANDMCTLYGIFAHHREQRQEDPESSQEATQIVLPPRVSEPARSSQAQVRDNFSCDASSAEGNVSAQASTLEDIVPKTCDWSAGGNSVQFLEKRAASASHHKADAARCRFCGNLQGLQVAQKACKLGKTCIQDVGEFTTPCGEFDGPTSSEYGFLA